MPRRKPKAQEEKKIKKEIRLPISKLIDTKFRDYAIYVLENRGIPSFYDGLTPVQRYILMNSPTSFTKTLSVVGESIKDGYHHGDMSLGKAIAKLARPFGSSIQILEGYGFFGTEVSPEPAAARYTSIRLSNKPAEILKKYKYLFTREDKEAYDPFWLDIPIGLTIGIVGISVGYKTTILPRKIEHIREYLEGKRKTVRPYFHDFIGSIQKYKGLENSWIISSSIKVVNNKIEVRELPPVMKYASVIKKLDWLFNQFEGRVKVINNSNTKLHIDIVYTGKDEGEWKEIQRFTNKLFSVIVREAPVFIKDGQVLVYDQIEEYLDDYQWQILRLDARNKEYLRDYTSFDLDFNRAKKLFIQFILQKRRTITEIDIFLKDYEGNIKSRLENLTSKKFTKDELSSTTQKIQELESTLKRQERELKKASELFEKTPDPTEKRGISSKKLEADLFDSDDVKEDNGIVIWDGEDPFEKDLKEFDE